MMAPMSNGDLGHHPEKMLPPPEAPDIQVDQEFIVNETNPTPISLKISLEAVTQLTTIFL